MFGYKTFTWIAVLATLVAAVVPASASTFDGTPYYDGYFDWEGQTPFYESNGLSGSANVTFSGDVNWIVYDSDGFANTVYNKDGDYNATSGEYVYVYQVVSTGNDQIHNFSVTLGNGAPADNAGWFSTDSSQVAPLDGAAIPSYSAFWDFPGIGGKDKLGQPMVQASELLAFCSPQSPTNLFGTLQDSGMAATVGVAGPGSLSLGATPEPSMVSLMVVGLGMGVAAWAARRGRSKTRI